MALEEYLVSQSNNGDMTSGFLMFLSSSNDFFQNVWVSLHCLEREITVNNDFLRMWK
jgi:hypothetical protein